MLRKKACRNFGFLKLEFMFLVFVSLIPRRLRRGGSFRLFCLCGFVLLLAGVFYCCAFDSGLDSSSRLSLRFHGSLTGALPSECRNPRFAVLWQSTSGAVSLWDVGPAAFDSGNLAGLAFNGNFDRLPNDSISNSDEYVVGKLWLYDDNNGNGRPDVHFPTAYEDTLALIHQARVQLQNEIAGLSSYSQFVSDPLQVSDSFSVRTGGLLYSYSSTSQILNQYPSGIVWNWRSLLKARFHALYHPNKWEDFFNPDGDFSSNGFKVGADSMVKTCQLQRYRPANYELFENVLESVTLKQAWLDSLIKSAKNVINQIWRQEASFPASEKIIGSSTQDFIIYFPTEASLKMAQDAEIRSAFSFIGNDRLAVGLNLVKCNDRGDCSVQKWKDGAIQIVVGDQTTPIFDFQSATSKPFLTNPIKGAEPADSLSKAQYMNLNYQYQGRYGKYECSCDTISVVDFDSSLWMELPKYGILRFERADSNTFFVEKRDTLSRDTLSIQVRFVKESINYKLLTSVKDQRTTAILSSSSSFYDLFIDKNVGKLFSEIDSIQHLGR